MPTTLAIQAETNYGITIATARAYGYTGPMRRPALLHRPEHLSAQVLGAEPTSAKINEIYPALAESLLDLGVLVCQRTAAAQLQRVLNVPNRQQRDHDDLEVMTAESWHHHPVRAAHTCAARPRLRRRAVRNGGIPSIGLSAGSWQSAAPR